MTSQLFNLCELRQIHATDFASEGSLTVGLIPPFSVFIFYIIRENFLNLLTIGGAEEGGGGRGLWEEQSHSPQAQELQEQALANVG